MSGPKLIRWTPRAASSRLGVIAVALALSACSHLASQSGGKAAQDDGTHQNAATGAGQKMPGQSAGSSAGGQQSLASNTSDPRQTEGGGTAAGGHNGAAGSDGRRHGNAGVAGSDDPSQGDAGVAGSDSKRQGSAGVAGSDDPNQGNADASGVGSSQRSAARLSKRNGKRGLKGDPTAAGGGASGEDGDEASEDDSGAAGAAGESSGQMHPEPDMQLANVSSPSNGVTIDEDREPQTLGGALPLVLGVNEEGRFDFVEYALRPEVQRILDDLTDKLKGAQYDRLDIVGYTDHIGGTDYNQRLSELRAYAVTRYLLDKGVPENKIHYAGRGARNPLTLPGECSGLDRENLITCLQKDRRVEIEASIHRKRATVLR